MLRTMFSVVAAVLGLLLCAHHVPAQTSGGQARNSALKAERDTCEIYPDVISARPDNCPEGKMALRRVKGEGPLTSGAPGSSDDAARVHDGTNETPASSLRIPDVPVLDQDGKRLHFYTDLLKGKTVAINFIFTTCTTTCPLLAATFTSVQRELHERVGRDVHLISISVDPVTDTPTRLKAWGQKFHVGKGWTLVTGRKPDIDGLLKALAASLANKNDHSPTVIIINDAQGLVTRTYGLVKPSQLVKVINDAMAARGGALPGTGTKP